MIKLAARVPEVQFQRILQILGFSLSAVAGVAVCSRSAYFAWTYCTVTPYWDFWNWLSDYQSFSAGRFTLHDLVKPHNEHRIVTARLVLLADAVFFDMKGRLAIVANMLLLVATGCMLGWLGRARQRDGMTAVSSIVIIVGLMTSLCQWQNLILPFQVEHAFMDAFLLAAALCALLATQDSKGQTWAYFWSTVSGICFVGSAISIAGGLLTAPWVLLIFSLRRFRLGPALLFAGIVASTFVAYFFHYAPPPMPPRLFASDLSTSLRLVDFAAAFLGSPLYPYDTLPVTLGLTGLALFGFSALIILRWRLICRLQLPGAMLGLFAIAGSIVTMAGAAAVSRASSGLSEALQPRYTTAALMFWCSLIPLLIQMLLFAWIGRVPRVRRVAVALQPGLLLVLLALVNLHARYSQDMKHFAGVMAAQAEAIRQDVFVPALFHDMYYGEVADAADRLVFLRAHHLAVFADDARTQSAIMTDAAAVFTSKSLEACAGQIDFAYHEDRTRLVIRGWLGSPARGVTAGWMALFTPTGHLVAVLPATEPRGKIHVNNMKFADVIGIYTGFSRPDADDAGGNTLLAFGLFGRAAHEACRLAAPIALSEIQIRTLVGSAPFTPLASELKTSNTAFAIAGASQPFNNKTFSSQAEGDQAIGDITFAARTLPQMDVVIPFAAGPSVLGQSLQAEFSDGATSRIDVPSDSVYQQWRSAILAYDTIAKHGGVVRITASDGGTGWGQWMVIGTPMLAKPKPDWAKLY